MHVGVDSFVSGSPIPRPGASSARSSGSPTCSRRSRSPTRSGLYSFGIGEHHREEYYDSAPPVILAAAAARTSRIRLGSAVAVLSADDPVRVFQQFATLDLISKGRIDLVVGRGSFTEAFPLFGLDLADYDSLFAEKLDLLLKIRDSDARHLVRAAPAGADRPGRLPAPGAGPAADLGRRRRHAGVVRAGRAARAAADGRDHRRRAAPVRAAGRPLPPRRRAGRARARRRCRSGCTCSATSARAGRRRPTRSTRAGTRCSRSVSRERGFPPPTRAQFDATSGPDGAFFLGVPDDDRRQARRVADQLGGVDRVSLQMTNPRLAHADLLRGIELLGTEVAPRVTTSDRRAPRPASTRSAEVGREPELAARVHQDRDTHLRHQGGQDVAPVSVVGRVSLYIAACTDRAPAADWSDVQAMFSAHARQG